MIKFILHKVVYNNLQWFTINYNQLQSITINYKVNYNAIYNDLQQLW